MSEPKKEVSQEVIQFHQIVKNGSLEELQEQLKTGIDVNTPGRNGENALMVAIVAKDSEKIKLLIEQGADPELTDDFNATALRHAVHANFVEGVRYLLKRGVDRGLHPKYALKKIDYGEITFDLSQSELPEELKGVMTKEEWQESMEETSQMMAEMGQNPTVEPIIGDVYNVEILNLFLEAGDDLNLAMPEMKRLLLGLSDKATFQSSPQDYQTYKSPKYGTQNPERMENPFWNDMIRIGCNAYRARGHFNDSDSFDGTVWCYDRFGSSLTPLKDGRFVQIGGEHEDYYDPDFYIYNDVVVHDGKGIFEIYGYPKDVFPPTDFHTATLVGDWIYIIGCLGYPEQRVDGITPVYRLKVGSWKIETVNTTGEMPGWLYEHRASYDPTKNVIRVEAGKIQVIKKNDEAELIPNAQQFELDLSSFKWRKRT
ncbi:ankyrin repeat domain-containing protein [Gimesia aquarii]|uniref:Ankyrin repeats (3 copies) n=1 Tax=Gimesia aquarii TaxID=2527964 RepID=A0A517VXI9_9PLAN|nr:ankyrin repeat domain-containing protein [Gimesia aquarii]QDT97715.1 Ankyrin repeats (3 copies) [Gimesia aquarii]